MLRELGSAVQFMSLRRPDGLVRSSSALLRFPDDASTSNTSRMIHWLLGLIGFDLLVFLGGLSLHKIYLRHIRHHHRQIWRAMMSKCPPLWRYFKGMPSTGLLISTFIGDPTYRAKETPGFLWMGGLIVVLNLVHVIALGAIAILSISEFLL